MSSSDNLAATLTNNSKLKTTTNRNCNTVTVANLTNSQKATSKETPLIKLTKVAEWSTIDVVSSREEEKQGQSEDQICSARSAQALIKEIEGESVAEIFKQRLVQHRRNISKTMVFSDQLQMRDPQMVSEIAQDIQKNMKKLEVQL